MRNLLWLRDSENGYGDIDRRMADELRNAETLDEADRIARRNGLRDATDAADWLKSRS